VRRTWLAARLLPFVAGALAWGAAIAEAAAPGAGAPAPALRRFALVVGHNRPPHAGLATLRYADDDAVRWAALMRTYGVEVELLTELDEESRRLYGPEVGSPLPPTRGALAAAMGRLRQRMLDARGAGARAVFYFVYAGHGDGEPGGEGYVALSDGRFRRRDLEEVVLAASPAEANHVVVDACRSYYFVYDRGPGGTRRPFPGRYFAAGVAARFPNTGFVLSSSSAAPSHEWEDFQAGVFSHEVRSALLGAADVDGDARVSYGELAAFLDVANRAVRNERYRPAFAVNPPRAGAPGAFFALDGATGGEVVVAPGGEGRRVLEDPLGVRWADLHPGRGQATTLRLPRPPWAVGQFFLRGPAGETEHRIPAGRRVALSDLPAVPAGALRRGPAHEAFTQLFALPFDRAALAAAPPPDGAPGDDEPSVAATAPAPAASPPGALRPLAWASLALGATGLAGAGVLTIDALRLRDAGADGEARGRLNARIERRNAWATVGAAAGAGLLATGGLLLYLDTRATRRAGGRGLGPTFTLVPGGAIAGVALGR
jgi:hypothetical protein